MIPSQIYELMDQAISDKVYFDLDNWAGPISDRTPISFETFMYDSMIMENGPYSTCIKVLMKLVNGFQQITSS
jgi:hypothetical protein